MRGDGRVILDKRDERENPVYQARLRVPNAAGYNIVTTKTANLREAERIALNLYEELYMTVRAGGSIKSRTFKQVFEEWEKAATATATTRQGKSWKPTADRVRTYAIEFFGAKKITEIGESDFADYWVWRKSNFARKAPTNGTLKRERASPRPRWAGSEEALGWPTSIIPPPNRAPPDPFAQAAAGSRTGAAALPPVSGLRMPESAPRDSISVASRASKVGMNWVGTVLRPTSTATCGTNPCR